MVFSFFIWVHLGSANSKAHATLPAEKSQRKFDFQSVVTRQLATCGGLPRIMLVHNGRFALVDRGLSIAVAIADWKESSPLNRNNAKENA
jgi:hypothetical protein